jgi:hypothetical protein
MTKAQILPKVKQFLIAMAIMTTAVLAFNALGVSPALAQINFSNEDNIVGGQGDIRGFVKTIVNYALGFLGLVCVVFIIYAGFLYVTAGTNEDNVGQAKNIITYTVIGIIIILASAAIVNFALDATGLQSGGSGATTTSGGTL